MAANSIVKGDLTVSILKDIRNLTPLAVAMADNLIQGKPVEGLKAYTMAELTNDPAKTGDVQALFLPVQQVNKDNVYDLVVKSALPGLRRCLPRHPGGQAPAQAVTVVVIADITGGACFP